MAVLDGLEGIEVTVSVGGQALHEYEDNESEAEPGDVGAYQASKTVSKYLEAVTDKEFSIKIVVKDPYKMDCPTLGFRIKVDGIVVSRPMLQSPGYSRDHTWERFVHGVKHKLGGASRRWSIKHFKFTQIQTTEDNSKLSTIEDDANRIGEVGEISISVFRKSKAIRKRGEPNYSFDSQINGEIHEKALKGQPKSHGTSLGAAQPTSATSKWDARFLDGKDFPLAIFRFKYRSTEALKSLLIIERSPEPEPEPAAPDTPALTSLVNDDDLTPAQKRKLEEFKKNLLEADKDSKVKTEVLNQERTAGIKRENAGESHGRKPSKKPKYRETTIIDLLDSDDEYAIEIDD